MKKVLIVLLTAGILTACGGKSTTTDNKVKTPAIEEKAEKTEEKAVKLEKKDKDKLKEEAKSKIELTDLVVNDSDITPYITGLIKNKTDKEIEFVELEFAVKDKAGNKIDSAINTTAYLKPGETREFEAISLSFEKEQFIDLEDYEVDIK